MRPTQLTLGEKTFQLAWDFNSMARVEAETGINLFDVAAFSPSSLRASLYAALLFHQPETTLEDAGALVAHPQSIKPINDALAALWESAE